METSNENQNVTETGMADAKPILTVKTSRISSLKSLFWPLKMEFYEVNGTLQALQTRRNFIGQKDTESVMPSIFEAKGIILRKLELGASRETYGRFWAWNVRKVKNLIKKYIPKTDLIRMTDQWF